MLNEFENKVADFVDSQGIFEKTDKLLLAISGGADSCALLEVMRRFKYEGVLDNEIVCGHVNHMLRKQADGDEAFVVGQCRKAGFAILTRRVDVNKIAKAEKISVETAARNARLGKLAEMAKLRGCNVIVTAHHMDDNAETVIGRMSRGTGIRGLGGIWAKKEFEGKKVFARVLLCVKRTEIEYYLQQKSLGWREDHTNQLCIYRRNFIRHKLIGELEKDYRGDLSGDILRLSMVSRRFYRKMREHAREVAADNTTIGRNGVELRVGAFNQQGREVKVELIRICLAKVGCGEQKIGREHYERILAMADEGISGRKIDLCEDFYVLYQYGKLLFGREQKSDTGNLNEIILEKGQKQEFGKFVIESEVCELKRGEFERFMSNKGKWEEWFDLDKIRGQIRVRPRRKGDKFVPIGLGREKKVGKFFTDSRISRVLRGEAVIFEDEEKILWVGPFRSSEDAKISGQTAKVLKVKLLEKGI